MSNINEEINEYITSRIETEYPKIYKKLIVLNLFLYSCFLKRIFYGEYFF